MNMRTKYDPRVPLANHVIVSLTSLSPGTRGESQNSNRTLGTWPCALTGNNSAFVPPAKRLAVCRGVRDSLRSSSRTWGCVLPGSGPTTRWIPSTSSHPLPDCRRLFSGLGDAFFWDTPKTAPEISCDSQDSAHSRKKRLSCSPATTVVTHHGTSEPKVSNGAGNQDPWQRDAASQTIR